MQLFADTGNIEELRELEAMGIIRGVTTNPTILSREGPDALESLRKIHELLPDYPLFAQVVSPDAEGMIEQAMRIDAVGPGMVVKIPATNSGLKAIAALKKKGVQICATTVFTAAEALLCAAAGADYVAPYTGENNVIGFSGAHTLREIAVMFSSAGIASKILAAAIYTPQDIVDAAVAGAHIATVGYAALTAVCVNPGPIANHYINGFVDDWNDAGAHF